MLNARDPDLLRLLEEDTVPSHIYNGVAGVSADLDGTLARVRSWGVPARWTVSSASTPSDHETALAERGLMLYDDWPGMVARVQDLPEPELGDATIDIVRSAAQSDEWSGVMRDALGAAAEAGRSMSMAHAWPHMHNTGLFFYLLRIRGTAVATGLLRSASGAAGVYGITVRRAFQRRGLGTLATLIAVQEGARRGATIATLQATKEGFPVYEKLGFQTITSFRSFR